MSNDCLSINKTRTLHVQLGVLNVVVQRDSCIYILHALFARKALTEVLELNHYLAQQGLKLLEPRSRKKLYKT